jgi:predicted metal-dependent hydrolase
MRRRAKKRALRRRYGCFRLPRKSGQCGSLGCIPEAKAIKAASHKGANWLARTDPRAKEVEFSQAWDHLTDEGKRYIVLHERAHLIAKTIHHNASFYEVLRRLIKANKVSWEVAYELENWNCHRSH